MVKANISKNGTILHVKIWNIQGGRNPQGGKENFKKTTNPKIRSKEKTGKKIVISTKMKVSNNKVNDVSKKEESLILLKMNIPMAEKKGVEDLFARIHVDQEAI